MTRHEQEQFVKTIYFDRARPRLSRLAARLTDDPDAVVADAAVRFDEMLPHMAYVDKPNHPLASALFICSVNLALYLAMRERGIDVHDFGRAMLAGLARAQIPVREKTEVALQQFIRAAEASQQHAAPGEDVFEFIEGGEDVAFDWGLNVHFCAICHAASRYEAMDLVPYMCAADDVMSDKNNEGLRRTGSIALGAHHCDFRYKPGGPPQPLAEQYPDQIRTNPA